MTPRMPTGMTPEVPQEAKDAVTDMPSPSGGSMDAPIIEVSNLHKQYGASVTALDHVTLSVASGEWVAIMGPSGSGKSTLLNILGGLDRPTSGEVRIAGAGISTLSTPKLARFRAEHVGFIFQQFHLIPYLTALENVMLAQYFHSISDADEAREMLARVGLDHRAHHLPSQLSGGEQQRVAIARAIINQPSMLLADEPTGNLDAENEQIIMSLLQQLQSEGRTILMVTHAPNIARFADRRVSLTHGRIVEDLTFSFEEEEAFDEVLEQIWVLEEEHQSPSVERIQVPALGSRRTLPVMKEIGLLAGDLPVLEMTAEGRIRAVGVIRRHRLAERLFSDTFEMSDEKELESNACTFEHILSPEVTERICVFLDHPEHCPHGSPIPPGSCCPERN